MPRIIATDFYRGGVSDSKRAGIAFSVPRMVGWNIHDEPGLMKVNQAMGLMGGCPTEFCVVAVDASTGIRYWFSYESGKIWQEKAGVWTLVYTTVPGAGAAICLGAAEYQGYIYWFTQNRVHRIPIALADGSSAWTTNAVPNWATFTNGDLLFHPQKEVNLVLYIGDGKYVAQIDAGVFSANALDISTPHRVSALAKQGTNLLVGTKISDTVNKCSVYSWNTWSVSFSSEDELDEPGVNAFIEADNFVLLNAGLSGNFYSWDGQQATFYKKIPGNYSPTKSAKVFNTSSAMFHGYPIFGMSNNLGDPCDEGIWSFGRHSSEYPLVRQLEWPISITDVNDYPILADVQIGAIIVSGVDVYMSWKNPSGVIATVGVDKLDYTLKIRRPFIELRIIEIDRSKTSSFKRAGVACQDLPATVSVLFKYKKNFATSWEEWNNDDGEAVRDADRMIAEITNTIDATALQARMEANISENEEFSVEQIYLDYD